MALHPPPLRGRIFGILLAVLAMGGASSPLRADGPARSADEMDEMIEIGLPIEDSDSALGNDCPPDDPRCDALLGHILAGAQIFPVEVEGGVTFDEGGEAGGAIRFGVTVLDLDLNVGDLEAIRFDFIYNHDRGGFRLRFTLADAMVQFFCRDAEEIRGDGRGKLHAPFAGMFNDCEPDGAWGLGGSLVDLQWDISTSRTVVRWAQIHAVYNFLRNGNGRDYLRKKLVAFMGASLDTAFPGEVPGGDPGVAVMPRLAMGIMGMIRTRDNRFELRGYAGFRPNMADFSDYAIEGETQLLYNLLFNEDWVATVGLNATASYWSVPSHSIGAFASDRDPLSVYVGALFRLSFR